MPLDREQLDTRLKGWAQEYGGGRYENIGWQSRNMLQTLIEHKGFVPNGRGYIPVPIRSAADEVEAAVSQMEATGWYKQGRVLRCDYFLPNAPMDIRLKQLKRIGVSIGRTAYFDALAQAKQYLAEELLEGMKKSA